MLGSAPFAFAQPWLLAALIALPALWWLLRVTPPSPKSLRFPAIRLLFGLTPPEDLAGDPAYPDSPEDFDRLIAVPTPILVEHESDWFARFNEIMQS